MSWITDYMPETIVAAGVAVALAAGSYAAYQDRNDFDAEEAVSATGLVRFVNVDKGVVEGQCSAVVTNYGVLSAGHCTMAYKPEKHTIVVKFPNGDFFSATVAERSFMGGNKDDETDALRLVLEPMDGQPEKPLRAREVPLACENPDLRDTVFAVGSPGAMRWVVAEGNVLTTHARVPEQSGSAPGNTGGHWIAHDAVIGPGMSGGPLFNVAGEVIGITSHSIGKGFQFASDAEHLCQFLGVTHG